MQDANILSFSRETKGEADKDAGEFCLKIGLLQIKFRILLLLRIMSWNWKPI